MAHAWIDWGGVQPEETSMAMEIGHVHIKTADPKATTQFYVDNFGFMSTISARL